MQEVATLHSHPQDPLSLYVLPPRGGAHGVDSTLESLKPGRPEKAGVQFLNLLFLCGGNKLQKHRKFFHSEPWGSIVCHVAGSSAEFGVRLDDLIYSF